MSFELKKLNVHKIVETEKQKDTLLNKGYVLVEEVAQETATKGKK